jgi:hypothetical protein
LYAGIGEHPAIADHNNAFEAKSSHQLFDLNCQGLGIGRVSLKYFDGDRTALLIAQQAIDNLQFAVFLIAIMAAFGQ